MSSSSINHELNDTSTFDSFSFSDSEVLLNLSNKRKQCKHQKIPQNEEVTTDFQFDRFGDEGNAIRVPCDVKFGTSVSIRLMWIESFKEVMSDNFIVTEKLFKSRIQLQCMYKGNTGATFESTPFYTNGTKFVQGKHTCTEWRDTLSSELKLASQTIKGLHDEIEILSEQSPTDTIYEKTVLRVQTPKQTLKSSNRAGFNSGILSSLAPIVEQSSITVDK
ncbi:unnamed protein product [Mytilus coruscus]|uniref:Uncharacterized protein n=1 Tax=Mytilus coruscus TaxID=42192 RepID=A0A6J8B1W8_MYTCO|nr:unnamed protein product [Mytilus coruscus]